MLRDRALWLLLAFALALRLPRLDASLSGDEAFSVRVARLPPAALIAHVAVTDVHPPLSYLALRATTAALGEGERAVRAPSVAASVALVAVVAALGRRWADRRAALLAAAWVAGSPLAVDAGTTARMYPGLALLSAVALWAWEDRPRLAVAALTAALYTHAAAVFVAVGLLAGWPGRWRQVAAAGVAFAPWALIVAAHAAREIEGVGHLGWIPAFGPSVALSTARAWLGLPGAWALAAAWWVQRGRPPDGLPSGPSPLASAPGAHGDAPAALRGPPGATPPDRAPLHRFLAAGLGAMALTSLLVLPVWLPKTTLPFLGPAMLAVAAVLRPSARLAVVLAGAVAIAAWPSDPGPGWRAAIAELDARALPGDVARFEPAWHGRDLYAVYGRRDDLRRCGDPDAGGRVWLLTDAPPTPVAAWSTAWRDRGRTVTLALISDGGCR